MPERISPEGVDDELLLRVTRSVHQPLEATQATPHVGHRPVHFPQHLNSRGRCTESASKPCKLVGKYRSTSQQYVSLTRTAG